MYIQKEKLLTNKLNLNLEYREISVVNTDKSINYQKHSIFAMATFSQNKREISMLDREFSSETDLMNHNHRNNCNSIETQTDFIDYVRVLQEV